MQTSSTAEPFVTVIIPALNEEALIGAALASVAAQTRPLPEIEAIVVDNGSRDRTGEIVRSTAAATPGLSIRLVSLPEPGRGRAKNRGAREARGQCLIFLDADSRMAPDLAARVLARWRSNCPAACIRVVADSHDRLDRAFFDLIEFGKRLFKIRAQMFYCGRDLFLRFGGFDEALKLAEDQEFLGRLQRAGVPVGLLDESAIATSARRLHTLPCRLGMLTMLARWWLADRGLGRRWHY